MNGVSGNLNNYLIEKESINEADEKEFESIILGVLKDTGY